jgi:DNA methylase
VPDDVRPLHHWRHKRVLRKLPDQSVDLVLSSPPFLALRSYLPGDHPDKGKEIGSEPTPGDFIDVLLDIVEECARVLTLHGSLCSELGDIYSGSGGAGGDYAENGLRDGQARFNGSGKAARQAYGGGSASVGTERYEGGFTGRRGHGAGGGAGWPLAKSLCLIPELFRISLVYGFNPLSGRQTPPWRARNVVRWVRPNPPVGALGDKFRPATSEMVVVCKSDRRYFDLDAVREERPAARVGGMRERDRQDRGATDYGGDTTSAPPLDWWSIPSGGFPGSHYAVYPPELCIRPIKAMSPERVCTVCGSLRSGLPGKRATSATTPTECPPV